MTISDEIWNAWREHGYRCRCTVDAYVQHGCIVVGPPAYPGEADFSKLCPIGKKIQFQHKESRWQLYQEAKKLRDRTTGNRDLS